MAASSDATANTKLSNPAVNNIATPTNAAKMGGAHCPVLSLVHLLPSCQNRTK